MAGTEPVTIVVMIDLRRQYPTFWKAADAATKAVAEDEKHNYRKALRLYKQALKHFHRALEREVLSDSTRQTIRDKCVTYSDRAKSIEEYLYGNTDKEGLIDSDDERPRRRSFLLCCR
ncbi:hypothetical protein HPB50_023012 [Hyalomma asiaticum]|uniref:Uncharacterized protein n=1 Tax=Hyalomma asiaticum TaxID=266040 RepID=A0ACB7SBC0_HYAAI|nr:hypothetical protein HPB50_023012 [Hyalomma asiaticum]